MNKIDGKAKTIRELLSGKKYSIDFYQREYKWEEKHIQELLADLSSKFLDSYDPAHERAEVEQYGNYFLGSIITSYKDGKAFIIDGQQRLTTLTILLIFLNNLQRTQQEQVKIDDLIFSEKYSKNPSILRSKSAMNTWRLFSINNRSMKKIRLNLSAISLHVIKILRNCSPQK
jgi:uncharacterized protein with ParB-like and HNH nuclease domain